MNFSQEQIHKFSFHDYNLDSSHRIYKCNYCGVSKHEEN